MRSKKERRTKFVKDNFVRIVLIVAVLLTALSNTDCDSRCNARYKEVFNNTMICTGNNSLVYIMWSLNKTEVMMDGINNESWDTCKGVDMEEGAHVEKPVG